MPFTHRLATEEDLPALRELMAAAIGELQKGFLTQAQIDASRFVMGLDTQLIADRTYFIVQHNTTPAGCGGWSFRAKLFGGDHFVKDSQARLLDPATEPARIRAMYTAPAFARQGVGRLILSLCEAAAVAAGFTRAELGGTAAGEPLYTACGYTVLERLMETTGPVPVPLARMGKTLTQKTV